MNKKPCVKVPESFFEEWGQKHDRPKFSNAEASSLSSVQLILLKAGVPVVCKRGTEFLKVFVLDSRDSFRSVVMPRENLKLLADDLLLYSVEFSASDRRTYGLE